MLLSTVEKTPDQESFVFCDTGIRLTFAEFMKEVEPKHCFLECVL